MSTLIACFAVLNAGQTKNAGKQMFSLEEIDTMLTQPVLITGIATKIGWKRGALIVYGKGRAQMVFDCDEWDPEVKKAYDVAQKTNSDLWVSMRVRIHVDPEWRADGKYPQLAETEMHSATSGLHPCKYYFSGQEVAKSEIKKRQADGSHAIAPEKPIQKDDNPLPLPQSTVVPQKLSGPPTPPIPINPPPFQGPSLTPGRPFPYP
jgi:hypothetical protein